MNPGSLLVDDELGTDVLRRLWEATHRIAEPRPRRDPNTVPVQPECATGPPQRSSRSIHAVIIPLRAPSERGHEHCGLTIARIPASLGRLDGSQHPISELPSASLSRLVLGVGVGPHRSTFRGAGRRDAEIEPIRGLDLVGPGMHRGSAVTTTRPLGA
jgi:hypothetical protein